MRAWTGLGHRTLNISLWRFVCFEKHGSDRDHEMLCLHVGRHLKTPSGYGTLHRPLHSSVQVLVHGV